MVLFVAFPLAFSVAFPMMRDQSCMRLTLRTTCRLTLILTLDCCPLILSQISVRISIQSILNVYFVYMLDNYVLYLY